jgi:hypothetical protein
MREAGCVSRGVKTSQSRREELEGAGKPFWGKRGIGIGLMGNVDSALYTGKAISIPTVAHLFQTTKGFAGNLGILQERRIRRAHEKHRQVFKN